MLSSISLNHICIERVQQPVPSLYHLLSPIVLMLPPRHLQQLVRLPFLYQAKRDRA
jgi:hypothetical protein